MGAGASVSEQHELEAFQAVREAYSKMGPNTDEVQAFEQLREVFLSHLKTNVAITSEASPLVPAVSPSSEPVESAGLHALVVEAMRLTDAEKEALAVQVLEAAVEEDKRKRPVKAPGAGAGDYGKSFGGTEQETRVEKEFEAMIRGVDSGGTASATHPLLLPCPTEAYAGLRPLGTWRRFLSVSGCYCYVHSLTHEMVAIRPEDYVDEPDAGTQGAGGAADESHGLFSCHISEVPRVLEEVIDKENLTPLFLDTSVERKLSSFFSYKSLLLDVSALSIGYAKTGLKTTDLMETARHKTVAALKAGQLLVLDLGSVTAAHANFKAKLCKKDCFPLEIFQEGGKKMFSPNVGPRYEKLFHDEDKEQGQCMVKPDGFRFAVLSSLSPSEYEALLAESIPLGYMKVIYVRS